MRNIFTSAAGRFLLTLIGCIASAPLLIGSTSRVDGPDRQTAAAEPSYVILLRHGDAPGRNEPASFDLNDCATQRNLSDKGRDEAREMGDALRGRGVNVAKVLASRWCRTHETAELLNLGPVEAHRTFDNLDFNKHRSVTMLERERQLIASWQGPGVLVIVTHSSNIKALTGLDAARGMVIVASPTDESGVTLNFGQVSPQNFPS
jgi:phosphohistidine phosphatase SixA